VDTQQDLETEWIQTMNAIVARVKKMTDTELLGLCDVIDTELEVRRARSVPRGRRRSTYMVDIVRGKVLAPRNHIDGKRRLAA